MAALSTKQDELAADDIAQIGTREEEESKRLESEVGPAEHTSKLEEYRAWFQRVGFHPDALLALNAAEEDRELGALILTTISAAGTTKSLLVQSGLPPWVLRRLLTLPAATLAALVAHGLLPGEFQIYAATPARVSLLRALQGAAVSIGKVRSLVEYFALFDTFVDDPVECGQLVTLLGGDTPAEIRLLCNAVSDPKSGKITVLSRVRPKAGSVADLVTVLQFCRKANWTHAQIINALNPLANPSTLIQLQNAVHLAHLVAFDKNANFSAWLGAVDLLVEEGYLNIQARGDWIRLAGEPITDERNYNVCLTVDGSVHSTFCVHYHPKAQKADVSSPYASKSHLKPERNGDVRYNAFELVASFRKHIDLKP